LRVVDPAYGRRNFQTKDARGSEKRAKHMLLRGRMTKHVGSSECDICQEHTPCLGIAPQDSADETRESRYESLAVKRYGKSGK